jgi:alpha-1,2-mannosyltransferase
MTHMTEVKDRSVATLVTWSLVAMAVLLAAANWLLVTILPNRPLWDLTVYREAIRFWVNGGDLYEFGLPHPLRVDGFPFTYPPFAALLLRPIAWIPNVVTDNVWTFATLALVFGIGAFVVWRAPRIRETWLGPTPDRQRLIALSAAAVILMLLSMPVSHDLVLGQVTLVVIAMALFDVGGLVPKRFQGSLVGLAAAIKLTPLIFIPYYVVTRQWRQAVVATGVFVAATLAALAFDPATSVTFWGDKIFDSSRVGELDTVQNKSILGLLARWDVAGTAQSALWLALALVVLAAALYQARRQFQVGQLAAAAIIMGCASIAVSPISWPHHQLWVVLAGVWLLLYRRPAFMVAGAVLVTINFVWSPLIGQEVIPMETDDPFLLHVARDIPTLTFILICLLGLPLAASRRPSPSTEPA